MDRIERVTYRVHRQAAIFEMMFNTILWSAADVARKGLAADVLAVTLITMAPGAAQLLYLVVAGRLAGMRHRPLLLAGALLGRSPLLLVFFVDGPWSFLVLLVVCSFSLVPITSAWNSLLRSNYSDALRGTLYGRATRVGNIFAAVAMLGAGLWLREQPGAYRLLFPLAAVFGLAGCFIFAGIPVRPGRHAYIRPARLNALSTLRDVFRDRNFLRYELGFFVYGLAFMSTGTAKPLFVARPEDASAATDIFNLDFGYDVLLGSRGLFALSLVLFTPYMGRLFDRLGPARLASRCFLLLAIYNTALLLTRNELTYCLAETFWGVAMAGVAIAWNLGPVTLAREGDAMRYMGAHVALVGFRAIIAHPLGGLITNMSGDPRWVFAIGIALFLVASGIMLSLARDLRARAEEASQMRPSP